MSTIVHQAKKPFGFRNYMEATLWLLLPLVVIVSIKYNVVYGILFLGAMFIAIKFLWQYWFLPVLFLVYAAIFPSRHWGESFGVFPFYFYDSLIFIIIIFCLLVVYYNASFNKKRHISSFIQENTMNILIITYVYYGIFQIIRGLAFGNNPAYILTEFSQLFMLLGFYIWYYTLSDKNILSWIFYVILLSCFVSIEYAYLVVSKFTNILDLLIYRPITNHAYIAIVSLPLTLGLFHIKKNILWRLLLFVFGFLQVVLIIISQKRMLWVELVFLFMLFYLLYVIRYGVSIKSIISAISLYALYFLFLFGLIYIGAQLLNVDLNIILDRWQGVRSLKDYSLMMRVFDTNRAMKIMQGNFIFGMGGGSEIRSAGSGYSYRFIDNSFIIALFKGGVIQLALLLAIYFVGLYRSYQIYRKAEYVELRIIGAALFTAIAGIIFSGLTEVSLLYFAHVYIWMIILAMTVILYERYIIKYNRLNGVYNCDAKGWKRI
ncbi:MAG: hypothetical protein V2A56_12675 [bacterium]